MLNVIKMDLRHMFKSKSTWIILIVAVALVLLSVFMSHFTLQVLEETPELLSVETETASAGADVGFDMQNPTGMTSAECSFFAFVMNYMSGSFPLLLLGIFAVMFVNSDNNSGFLKSISGQLKNRENLIFAKLISLSLYSVMLIVTSIIASLVSVYIVFPSVSYGNANDFILFMLVQLLLHIAFAAVIVCIVTIIRNSALSMVISIVLSSGLVAFIYSLINYALPSGIRENFKVEDYTITNNISLLSQTADSEYVRAVIVGAVYVLLATVLSVVIFKKKDIK